MTSDPPIAPPNGLCLNQIRIELFNSCFNARDHAEFSTNRFVGTIFASFNIAYFHPSASVIQNSLLGQFLDFCEFVEVFYLACIHDLVQYMLLTETQQYHSQRLAVVP